MNERIKQLADQAGVSITAANENGVFTLLPDDVGKFAELLIRECASVAGKYIHENKYTENGVSDFWLKETIKEHFGVAE